MSSHNNRRTDGRTADRFVIQPTKKTKNQRQRLKKEKNVGGGLGERAVEGLDVDDVGVRVGSGLLW